MIEPKRILIIDFLAIGDLLFTTPLLRTLRYHYNRAKIACVINSNLIDVLKYNPHVDEIIGFDKIGKHASISGYLSFIRELRSWNPDMVITLQDNPRLSLLALLSGARCRVGFAKHFRRLAYTVPVKADRKQHSVEYYLDIAHVLGIKEIHNRGLEMWFDEQDVAFVDKIFHDNNISDSASIIGLGIGGSWPTKMWPAEYFSQLVESLNDFGHTIVLIGGTNDLAHAETIIRTSSCSIVNAVGKTTIRQLAPLISRCKLFISNDTGPMHIAVSQGVPVIAVFGPSDELRYAPYEHGVATIKTDIECRPCGRKKCPYGHWNCMTKINPQKVADEALKFLQG